MKTLQPVIVLLWLLFLYPSYAQQADLKFYTSDGVTEIPDDGTNFPEEGAYTHFGMVPSGQVQTISIVVRTESLLLFPIFWAQPLLYTGYDASGNPTGNYTGTEFTVTPLSPTPNPFFIPAGSTFTFSITFSPQSNGVKDLVIDLQPFLQSHNTFNVRGIGLAPEIELSNKVNGISFDNGAAPLAEHGTDLGTVGVNSTKTQSFQIRNNGQIPLSISNFNLNNSVYQLLGANTTTLQPGQTTTFEIAYTPNNTNTHTAQLLIGSNDPDDDPFVLNLTGSGTNLPADFGKLMISQTFENGNNDVVEVKNISGTGLTQSFYLGRYARNRNLNGSPNTAVSLGSFAAGEVKTFPLSFAGDDVLVISTANNNQCYRNRIEIVGIQNTNWGTGRSLTKGTCSSETAHLTFQASDWVELELPQVQNANDQQNIALGTYNSGLTAWVNNAWSNGMPDQTRWVRISAVYNRSIPFSACDLEVVADLNFDHDQNQSIEVYRDLTIGPGTFTLGDLESLVMYNDNASVQGTLRKIEKTTPLQRIYDATYWSAPVENPSLATTFNGVNTQRIFRIDPSKKNPLYAGTEYEHWFRASGTMLKAQGYSVEGKQLGINTFTFEGKPNNGKIFKQVLFNYGTGTAFNDYNLIGNPYPSAIDPDQFIEANQSVIDGALYLWQHQVDVDGNGHYSDTDYIAYNYSGSQFAQVPSPFYLSSSQGFMVNAIRTGNVEFSNAMRVVGNNQYFYKAETRKAVQKTEKDRVWIRLADQNNSKKETLIGFFDRASDAFDYGYDAYVMGTSGFKIYSLSEARGYAIQAFGKAQAAKEIALGFEVAEAQPMTLGISKLEGVLKQADLYLIDQWLQVEHNLKHGDYTFQQGQKGKIEDRFILRFESLNFPNREIEEVKDLVEGLRFAQDEDEIRIQSDQPIKAIQVFDVFGRSLMKKEDPEKEVVLPTYKFKKGTFLIFQITLQSGEMQSKKLIVY